MFNRYIKKVLLEDFKKHGKNYRTPSRYRFNEAITYLNLGKKFAAGLKKFGLIEVAHMIKYAK